MGDVFRALADPTRRAIVDELCERGGQTLFEICGRLAMRHSLGSTRQAVSQHLDVLEQAGLVVTRRQGRFKFHDVDLDPLRDAVQRWLPGGKANAEGTASPPRGKANAEGTALPPRGKANAEGTASPPRGKANAEGTASLPDTTIDT